MVQVEKPYEAFPLVAQALAACHPGPVASEVYAAGRLQWALPVGGVLPPEQGTVVEEVGREQKSQE